MVQNLTLNQIVENLWCGTVINFNHDMLEQSLELQIKVLDSGIESNYNMVFLQISNFEILYENPENTWEYVELTEITVKKENNFYNIHCNFWSTGEMKLICKKIMVNEVEVKE